ncbi:MAG: 50S ribosomal protein L32e [Promethearchaeota archaeon]
MTNYNFRRLIRIKRNLKRRRPSFRRVESWRYKRVKPSWRAAKGIDSKTRQKLKSGVKSPNIGYRCPKKVRYLHPSGYKEVVISNIKDLENLNPKKHAIKLSKKLGMKKKIELVEKIKDLKFKILNYAIEE